jgi:hypothetical protein
VDLQALREIEAMSGVTFLHSSSCKGISGLFDVSPDDGLLSKVDEDAVDDATCNTTCFWPAEGCGAAYEEDGFFTMDFPLTGPGRLSYGQEMTCQAAVKCQASSPVVSKRGFDIAAS